MDNDILKLYVKKAMRRIEDLYYSTGGDCYLSFSGGKDSTIVLALIKLCEKLGTIPKNAIPAVFCDTKIELGATLDFVAFVKYSWYSNLQVIKPDILFPQVLNLYGKPLRSKAKSSALSLYYKNPFCSTARYLYDDSFCRSDRFLLANRDFHFLHSDFDIRVSNECCNQIKKKPFHFYAIKNQILGYMTGEREAEGGLRSMHVAISESKGNACTSIVDRGIIKKKPIVDWSDDVCNAFISLYSVPLSKAYTEYGATRTGCFCCPFALDIADNLEMLHEYEPNRYKAALFYLKDVYIAQGVILLFDSDYMHDFEEKWKKYEVMRYEMLKKFRPDCRIVKNFEHGTQLSFFD